MISTLHLLLHSHHLIVFIPLIWTLLLLFWLFIFSCFRLVHRCRVGVFFILCVCCILSFAWLLLDRMLALVFVHLLEDVGFFGEELRFDEIVDDVLKLKRTCWLSHVFISNRNMIFVYRLLLVDGSEVRNIWMVFVWLQRMP